MASKKKQADDAYERGEDQRALVLVLDAADQWARAPWGGDPQEDDRPLRDALEAALLRVRARLLVVGEPVKPEPSLPGQINLFDGSIETCPACGVPDPWAAITGEPPRLQCGHCGKVIAVSYRTYDGIIARRRQQHQHMDTVRSPVIPEKKGPTRGAG